MFEEYQERCRCGGAFDRKSETYPKACDGRGYWMISVCVECGRSELQQGSKLMMYGNRKDRAEHIREFFSAGWQRKGIMDRKVLRQVYALMEVE